MCSTYVNGSIYKLLSYVDNITIYPSFFGVRLCQEYVMLCADHYLYHISLKSYFLMGLYFKALIYYCSDNSEATSNEAGIHTTSLMTYGTAVYMHVQMYIISIPALSWPSRDVHVSLHSYLY